MRQLRGALEQAALSAGFDRLFVARAQRLEAWQAQAGANPHWKGLTGDPEAVLPGVRRAIVLLRGYLPYAPRPGLVTLSAYYPCSQQAYLLSRTLCAPLQARGYRALCHPPLPYKPLLALAGAARYGANGLTATDDFGSRFAVQVVLTDAPLAVDAAAPFTLPSCSGCGACVRRCPVGALGAGSVDVSRCLRALDERAPVPETLRPLLGGSLLGCDLCQEVCPRNSAVGTQEMPQPLSDALSLARLLQGDIKPLIPFIGVNYARKKRLQARACLSAANLGRTDCLPLLDSLLDDPYEPLRVHARWARTQLRRQPPSPGRDQNR